MTEPQREQGMPDDMPLETEVIITHYNHVGTHGRVRVRGDRFWVSNQYADELIRVGVARRVTAEDR